MRFNYILLGKLIEKGREEKNISKNELSRLIGVSATEIRRIENGERKVPNLVILINICEVLEFDFIELLKVTGFVDRANLIKEDNSDMKEYKITIRKGKEYAIGITAENEDRAIELAEQFYDKNPDIFEKNMSDSCEEYVDFGVEDFENSDEEMEDFDEKFDEDYEDDLEENSCEGCRYYCPYCKECVLDD